MMMLVLLSTALNVLFIFTVNVFLEERQKARIVRKNIDTSQINDGKTVDEAPQ
jgi:hypothetical protein